MISSTPTLKLLRFGTFELDPRSGELRKGGTKLRLRGQPIQVLTVLLTRAGQLVTRDELRAEVWRSDTFVDFDHSLHNAIARLREALGDSVESPQYIETLPRLGYRFVEKVDAVETGMPAPAAESSSARIQSVAVLPLQDHSSDREYEYFAEGMTEALITSLAKIKALRVISRTSAMQYKGARKPLPQIARELNVDAVIEGSVLRSGDRVRIAAQLIHAASDQHIWAESYERDFRDVLALQSEIARQVANEVRIALSPAEEQSLRSTRRINPESHELYLKGRFFWNKRTEESVRKALVHFQNALAADPTYAQVYAGIADCHNILGYYNVQPPADAYLKAKAAALKAIELGPSLGEPHAALAVVKRDFDWDWRGAESEFQRAIELSPGYVESHHWRSTLLAIQGDCDTALREKKRVLAMDPLSVVIQTDVARMLYFARKYDDAIAQYLAALDMDPNFASAHIWLARAYLQKQMFSDSIAALESGCRLTQGSPYALAELGHACALAGDFKKARAVLEELLSVSSAKYVSPYDVALVYVGMGQKTDAMAQLHKALEHRAVWLGYLKVEPQWDPLRAEPAFFDLLKRVGLD